MSIFNSQSLVSGDYWGKTEYWKTEALHGASLQGFAGTLNFPTKCENPFTCTKNFSMCFAYAEKS